MLQLNKSILLKKKLAENTNQSNSLTKQIDTNGLLARMKANLAAQKEKEAARQSVVTRPAIIYDSPQLHLQGIEYTEAQKEFILRGAAGESLVLFGAAGTGKTTSLKGLTRLILEKDSLPELIDTKHRYLLPGMPGIVITSYMNRAVFNDKKVLPELAQNCITIHKLLEYEPVWEEIIDTEGKTVNKMSFQPKRNGSYKLDSRIRIIVIDEAGNTPLDLYQLLIDALPEPEKVQFIFMGDLYQVPPVFGGAVLGFKGAELKENRVILTEVKRQDKDSPILSLATKIRHGQEIPSKHFPELSNEFLQIKPWKRKVNEDTAILGMAEFMKQHYHSGAYNPTSDIIIMLQNVKFGIDEMNRHIAQFLTSKDSREVYEIIAGFNKYYYSPGDIVFYNKEDFIIKEIIYNLDYEGLMPQHHAKTLNYWGHNTGLQVMQEMTAEEVEASLNQPFQDSTIEERKKKASHTVIIQSRLDPDRILELDTASEINNLRLGYACTVHRALGSEWEKVFFLIHHTNKSMLYRELLYTGITRAQKYLTIVCETDTFIKGVQNQKIAGESVEEKLMYFQNKVAHIPRFKK